MGRGLIDLHLKIMFIGPFFTISSPHSLQTQQGPRHQNIKIQKI